MVQLTKTKEVPEKLKVGVLALQGAFIEHIHILQRLPQVSLAIPVRNTDQLSLVDALIIPGGESTTIALVAERSGLLEPLREFVRSKPTWGTCAGMILLANEVTQVKEGGQKLLGGLDITVTRNKFGSQIDSFEAPLHIQHVTTKAENDDDIYSLFPAVFIRAPVISQINSPDVKVIARLEHSIGDTDASTIVAVRQDHLLATAFHPELTKDDRMHQYFVNLALESLGKRRKVA
ncbi:11786_t:CDS:2 [Ambispora leptoticha]|uniref:glutaminase n=1 Tax=Ambispora leptoticha TaxID=144679 RepID=A0A9N9E380_9GLOM|nr:11786_t:CDS:2 [Ambispora leptoticha]